LATVSEVDRRSVVLDIGERKDIDRELPAVVEVGVALPKGDRGRWLVEKLTELGISRLVPLVTERSVARVDEKSLTRLRRGVVEASKQCGRNRLMEIVPAEPWPTYVQTALSVQSAPSVESTPSVQSTLPSCRLVAHLDPSAAPLHSVAVPTGANVSLAVGPEGGLTDEEADQAVASGWLLVSLGPRILRVETAGVALAAWAAGQVR
jgi:16S rRNA (uracil1498-N3)-methyltransferase